MFFPLLFSNYIGSRAIPAAALNVNWSEKQVMKLESGLKFDSQLRVASLTKSFTAVAVMQLVDSGLVELDESVSVYGLKIERRHLRI